MKTKILFLRNRCKRLLGILSALVLVIFWGCANPVSSDTASGNSGDSDLDSDSDADSDSDSDFGTASAFPQFVFMKYVIDPQSTPTVPAELYHNPSGEYDFPSVVDTDTVPALRGNNRGRYFLYYSPHNSVGGINVAFADDPEGPWIAYEGNPVIRREILPTQVSHNGTTYKYGVNSSSSGTEHVSTGHPVWNPEQNKLFMYFHGYCNRATHFATSDDGLNFTYGDIAVAEHDYDLDNDGDGISETRQIDECSNARVYRYEMPGKTSKYVLMVMGATLNTNEADKARNIYMAVSDDGWNWTAQKEPLIHYSKVTSGDYTNLSAPTLLELNGRYFITVQASSGTSNVKVNAHLFEVKKDFTEVSYQGLFFESSAQGLAPDYGRIGGRSFLRVGEVWYMFYEAGQRGSTRIALARSYSVAELNEIKSLVLENGATTVTRGQGGFFTLGFGLKRLNGEVLLNPSEAVVSYQSNNPDVVSILDGKLFANGTGIALVTVEVSYQGITLKGNLGVEVIDGTPWGFVDDRFSLIYTNYWTLSEGNGAAAVNTTTQNLESGLIRMAKTSSSASNSYRYLTKTFAAQTEPGATFETRARLYDTSLLTSAAEFTVRANNKQYTIYLDWDTATSSGHVKNLPSAATKTFTLDTRVFHVFRVIVSEDGLTYDVYVDGTKVFTADNKTGSGSNIVKLGFDTTAKGNMEVDYFKLKWGIELP